MGFDNPIHIIFLLLLLLLVFGAKRLPEMGRSLGTGMRGFKESLSGEGAPAHTPAQPGLATSELVDDAASVPQHAAAQPNAQRILDQNGA